MKHIHLPTLGLHAALLLLAAATINDYPDAFLPIGIIVLIGHILWAARSSRSFFLSHLLGSAAQFAVFHFDLIPIRTGGLSGAGFALFFYSIALAFSCGMVCIFGLIKHHR